MDTNKSTVIITGGNTGIGFHVGKHLAWKGCKVILACRSEERGEKAVEDIKQLFPKSDVTFMKLDLSSLPSVRYFVEIFKDTHSTLDILINNAGVYMTDERQVTEDGLEVTMATNHLGHFLLTNLLLEVMKKTATENGEVRIVNITSVLHNHLKTHGSPVSPLDIDDFMLENQGAYGNLTAYSHSKLCNVLFTYELARRLDGTGVTVNCVCPGFIPATGLKRNTAVTWMKRFFMEYILFYMLRPFGKTKTVQEGRDAVVQVAIADELKGITGKFYSNMKEEVSSDMSYDTELQSKVWDKSSQLVLLEPNNLQGPGQ